MVWTSRVEPTTWSTMHVGLRLLRAHVVIPVGILLDLLGGLAGVLCDDLIEGPGASGGFPSRRWLCRSPGRRRAARGLVEHHPAVRQGEPLALGAGCEEHGAHAGSHSDAVRHDIALEKIDRVVDRHAARHHAAGRVDVDMDVLLRVLHLEEEELGDDEVGDVVVDGVPMKMMRSLRRRE